MSESNTRRGRKANGVYSHVTLENVPQDAVLGLEPFDAIQKTFAHIRDSGREILLGH